MTIDCEILRLRSGDSPALAEFFLEIASDPGAGQFHPHPFTREQAQRICKHSGADYYGVLRVGGRMSGYGMLRGWDEGYAVPSLGIYVAASMRGTGAARLMMSHMHLIAKLSGARQIRLKAYPDNAAAIRLYESMGYAWQPNGDPSSVQKIGILNL